jgi:hypothetical protein
VGKFELGKGSGQSPTGKFATGKVRLPNWPLAKFAKANRPRQSLTFRGKSKMETGKASRQSQNFQQFFLQPTFKKRPAVFF